MAGKNDLRFHQSPPDMNACFQDGKSVNTCDQMPSKLLQCGNAAAMEMASFVIEAGSPDDYGILAVDAIGRIRACSESMAEMAGIKASDLLGEPARGVLAGLPMKDETVGYNLAWAAFNAAQPAWHPYQLHAPDGRSLAVEVFVTRVAAYTAQLLLLVVRRHGE